MANITIPDGLWSHVSSSHSFLAIVCLLSSVLRQVKRIWCVLMFGLSCDWGFTLLRCEWGWGRQKLKWKLLFVTSDRYQILQIRWWFWCAQGLTTFKGKDFFPNVYSRPALLQLKASFLPGLSVQLSHIDRNISSCAPKEMILNTNENTDLCKTSWRMLSSIWSENIIPHPLLPSRVWTLYSRDAILKNQK